MEIGGGRSGRERAESIFDFVVYGKYLRKKNCGVIPVGCRYRGGLILHFGWSIISGTYISLYEGFQENGKWETLDIALFGYYS